MIGSKGIIGWVSSGIPNVAEYSLNGKSTSLVVSETVASLTNVTGAEENGHTCIEFSRFLQPSGGFAIDLPNERLLYAIRSSDGLGFHDLAYAARAGFEFGSDNQPNDPNGCTAPAWIFTSVVAMVLSILCF